MSDALRGFDQTPRPYQANAIEAALDFACSAMPGERRLWAAFCGSGKGSMQLAVRNALDPAPVIITPSLEIVRGYFDRCGVDTSQLSAEKLRDLAEGSGIYTPVTARNRYLAGDLAAPECVLVDEAHHATDAECTVAGDLFALWPEAIWLGYTATPFRGSPKQTLALREAWGEPRVIATLPELIELGHVSLPRFSVEALLDDDQITVKKGGFQIGGKKGADALIFDRAEAIAALVKRRCLRPPADRRVLAEIFDVEPGAIKLATKVPTVVITPSRASAGRVCEELDALGIGWRMVIGTTSTKARAEAYSLCESCSVVLVTVNVLAEGVDLPWLGCLVDCSPTLSPVAWLQRIGRVMRPKAVRPEVIVCCRNLERWSFLLAGALPNAVIKEALDAFEKPSKRAGVRCIGFEKLNRFKALQLPLSGDRRGQSYHLYSSDENGTTTEHAILIADDMPEPIAAKRCVSRADPETGKRIYERWQACAVPLDLTGFATSRWAGDLSPKQRAWWERAAAKVGLDPNAADSITQREFAALPVLLDSKSNLYPKAGA